MKKITLLNSHVLIKMEKEEEKTAGGIYIAPTRRPKEDKYLTGTIIAIADSVKEDEENLIDVKVGDKVVYDQYASAPYKYEDKVCTISKINSLVAIIN